MSLPDPLTSTHRYIPNAGQDVREMLATIGVSSVDALFETIPADVKLKELLDIPGPWSEIETRRWFNDLARKNKSGVDHARPRMSASIARSVGALVAKRSSARN